MSFPDEYTAFKTYARLYPNSCTLLVDTYDVLKSGVPNAIRVFEEMREEGIQLKNYGIRIDSGDLAYLSKKLTRCWLLPVSMMLPFPHPAILMNILSKPEGPGCQDQFLGRRNQADHSR